MRALLLAVVLAGCACARGPSDAAAPPPVELSFVHVTPVLALDLLEASYVWADVGGYLVPAGADETKVVACTADLSGVDIGIAAAVTTPGGIVVDCLYALALPKPARLHLLAHELGHAFGLKHVADPLAMMWLTSSKSDLPELDGADIAEWNRVHDPLNHGDPQ